MDVIQIAGEICWEDPRAELLGILDHRDANSERPSRRSNLEPDPASADDEQPPARPEVPADSDRILDAAQIVHARKLAPSDRKAANPAAGSEQQAVIGKRLARCQLELVGLPVNPRDA